MIRLSSLSATLALTACSLATPGVDGDQVPSAKDVGGTCSRTAWYADNDGDHWGDPTDVVYSTACHMPNRVRRLGDCDDTSTAVHKGHFEVCDGVDNDCDGLVDGDDDYLLGGPNKSWYHDWDGDGFGDPDDKVRECSEPTDYVSNDDDCDDTDSGINPDATDDNGDGVDDDCDGHADEDISTLTVADLAEGDLVITEIMQNPSTDSASDSDGEWFEVRNDSGADVDLEGLDSGDDPDGSSPDLFTVSGSLVVADGDYVVFGINDDSSANGGVSVDYDWGTTGDFQLSNSADEVILSYGGYVIDEVWYDGGGSSGTFPDPTGASMSLDPGSSDAGNNDYGTNWCEATSSFGVDDGTPGADNDSCSSGS